MTKAAVIHEVGGDFELMDVEVREPGPGDVLIRLAAAGICHSDYSIYSGVRPILKQFPAVLGHEASGVVEAVGDGVTSVSVGDHVVVAFKAMCGECWYCTHGQSYLCNYDRERMIAAMKSGELAAAPPQMTAGGKPVYPFGVATYRERAVVSEHALVRIPDDAPFEVAALLGCGVMTGFGAAANTADIRPGDSVVVVGCGGVGLSAIQGARVAGAADIIAVDLVDSKLEIAKKVGATTTVNARGDDPVDAIRSLTGGRGGDHVFEVIGLERTIHQSIEMTRPGGETILVGLPSESTNVVTNAVDLIHENRTIRGSMYGSCDFRHDVIRLLDLYDQGTLFLDELISRRLDLAHVKVGFEAMEAGDEARSVIIF